MTINFKKALCAIATSAAITALALPASAAGLSNVISSSSTQISGNINSTSSSWDQYAGAQITVSETSSQNGSLGANLTGLGSNSSLGGNLNLYGQNSQDWAGQANVTYFKGGDNSTQTIHGTINQTQTSFTTGVQTSFGN